MELLGLQRNIELNGQRGEVLRTGAHGERCLVELHSGQQKLVRGPGLASRAPAEAPRPTPAPGLTIERLDLIFSHFSHQHSVQTLAQNHNVHAPDGGRIEGAAERRAGQVDVVSSHL